MGRNGISAEQAIEAVKGSRGFVTQIAKRLAVSRRTVYNLINRYTSVREAVEDEREKLKDFAESKLFNQISNDNMTAIIFYLKTQAKERGYIERQDINVQVENELNRALDLLEQRLLPKEYEHVINILSDSKSSTTKTKAISATII